MMREEEEEMNGMEMIRRKLDEWSFRPYYEQEFNKDESPDWSHHINHDPTWNHNMITRFLRDCNHYKCFDFSIGTKEVGGVKLCSYSELQQITDFKDESLFIHKTLAGRLFRGTVIGDEGSQKRSVIVKTWDFLLPYRLGHAYRPHDFCDQIELFTNRKANTHPKLANLCTFCCDTRLAAVYDQEFDENTTTILSDGLFNDDFGWDDRMKVAIQLADLLVWLHDKDIILASVTASCILIEDKEMNIKVFDYGPICDHVLSPGTFVCCHLGRQAPDAGKMTTKSDVYVFALLLAELITKKEYDYSFWYPVYQRSHKNMVDESFKEADPETGTAITSMIYNCTDFKAEKRPTMKYVLDVLTTAATTTTTKMGSKGEKRKREENIEADTLKA